jgi:hypothetical protein
VRDEDGDRKMSRKGLLRVPRLEPDTGFPVISLGPNIIDPPVVIDLTLVMFRLVEIPIPLILIAL